MSKQLKLAIEKDDPGLVLETLKRVKNINRALPGADKPLEYACKKGAAKAVAVLLDAGARVNKDYGFSPFDIAAEHGQVAVMEVLCQKNKVIPAQVESALDRSLIDNHEKSVRFILEKFKPEITPRHIKMAMIRKSGPLLKLLLKHGGDINALDATPNGDGMAPLQAEARAGDPKTIRLLIEHGAEVDIRDRDGRTPLMHLASDMGFLMRENLSAVLRAIRTLLELGADASLKDKDGNDVITHYEVDMRRSREEIDPKVIKLLRDAGACGGGSTGELFEAIVAGDTNRVKMALAQGGDLSQKDPFGSTPLTLAAGKGSTDIVQLLLDAGADPNAPSRSETPLIDAATSGHLAVVKQLIAAGARIDDLEPGDDDDPTPRRNALLAAQWNRKFEVVDYLKSLGAERPKPAKWKPLQPGIASWNDFDALLVKADVETAARTLAKMIGGKVQANAYGKTLSPAERAYVVVRPRGMSWSNVFQVAPIPQRFENSEQGGAFAKKLAAASGASVLTVGYSDTSDAAAFQRFEPDGSSVEDKGWDRESLAEMVGALGKKAPAWAKKRLAEWDEDDPGPSSTERLKMLAEEERFVLAAFGLALEPGRPVDIEFTGYPAEAFDGVAIIG